MKQVQFTENEIKAKRYYDSLAVGAEFQYRLSDGTIVTARKSSIDHSGGKRADCEVAAGIKIIKNPKRFPNFSMVIVPSTVA